jgi:hypothetical protein
LLFGRAHPPKSATIFPDRVLRAGGLLLAAILLITFVTPKMLAGGSKAA